MRTKTIVAGLGVAVAALLLSGCATSSTRALLDEPQVAEDALPYLPLFDDEDTIRLVPSSSRLLGDAEGARFWAARGDDGLFCVRSMLLRGR